MVPCFSVALLAVMMTTAQSQQPTTWKVYFLGGQSNMDGFGYVSDLPEPLRSAIPGVMIFRGNTAPDDGEVDGRGVWAR